jgi:hypothetical protein
MKSSGVESWDRKFHGGVNTHAAVSSHFSSLSCCEVNISFDLSSLVLLPLSLKNNDELVGSCHTPFRDSGNEASIRVPRMFHSHV